MTSCVCPISHWPQCSHHFRSILAACVRAASLRNGIIPCGASGPIVTRTRPTNFLLHHWAVWLSRLAPTNFQSKRFNASTSVLSNLRLATHAQNVHNSRKMSRRCSSTLKGASWHKRSKNWLSSIYVDGKTIYLGRYQTAEEANHAYLKAAQQYFGEFARAS